MNSRLISSPTTKKKSAISASSTQCCTDCANPSVPNLRPMSVCRNALSAAASGLFTLSCWTIVWKILLALSSGSLRSGPGAGQVISSLLNKARNCRAA